MAEMPVAVITLEPGVKAEIAPDRFDAIIEAWFARHFHNSPVSRDTELFNHVHAAKEDLKKVMKEI
jgi:hypothetical protein